MLRKFAYVHLAAISIERFRTNVRCERILPSSSSYLKRCGHSPRDAALMLTALGSFDAFGARTWRQTSSDLPSGPCWSEALESPKEMPKCSRVHRFGGLCKNPLYLRSVYEYGSWYAQDRYILLEGASTHKYIGGLKCIQDKGKRIGKMVDSLPIEC